MHPHALPVSTPVEGVVEPHPDSTAMMIAAPTMIRTNVIMPISGGV
jgi:hypothetical protein